MIISLARPMWGYNYVVMERKGVDLILALDVSQSMLAKDVSPNRLIRAKREIKDLLKILKGDRVGLLIFSGVTFLQTPLTLDYGALEMLLNDVSVESLPVPGTAISDAILDSIKAFGKDNTESRSIILITDGEDHEKNPLEVIDKAKKENVRIYTIGVGGEQGAPIPSLSGKGFKKDRMGNVVLTKINEKVLKEISKKTGGSYVKSVTGDFDLDKIYKDIQRDVDDKTIKSGKKKKYIHRYQYFLIISLIFYLLFLVSFRNITTKLKENI